MVDRILCLLIPKRARLEGCKIIKPAAIASAAAFLMLCPAASAQIRWDAPRVVTWNCSGCHGIDGNAQPLYFPRLAGLAAAYAEKRMAEFRAADPPHVDELFYRIFAPSAAKPGASALEAQINMIGIAHAVTTEETKTSAEWYARQTSAPQRSSRPALIQMGRTLYRNGVPSQGLLPCQTCHGAQAEGKAQTPRLAGQNAAYLLGELAKFKAGDRQHAPEMTTVMQHVESEQFQALAAYLQAQ